MCTSSSSSGANTGENSTISGKPKNAADISGKINQLKENAVKSEKEHDNAAGRAPNHIASYAHEQNRQASEAEAKTYNNVLKHNYDRATASHMARSAKEDFDRTGNYQDKGKWDAYRNVANMLG